MLSKLTQLDAKLDKMDGRLDEIEQMIRYMPGGLVAQTVATDFREKAGCLGPGARGEDDDSETDTEEA